MRGPSVSQLIGHKQGGKRKERPSGTTGKVYDRLMSNIGAPTFIDDLFVGQSRRNKSNVIQYLRNMFEVNIVVVQRSHPALYMVPHEKV